MKAIINGKRYDTETATQVGHTIGSHGNVPVDDFHYWEEALYRTQKAAYFTAGRGGARSKYAESAGQNAWQGGEGITPLTEAEAREWLEESQQVSALEQEFPDSIEDA